MIEVEGLSKRYGSTLAVDDISFHIRKGEVVGLLGPNGAGKTTTMKILTCYISATAGRAAINGFDTFDQPLKVREHIGYLPESCPLYHDSDVVTYLNFCADVRGLSAKARKAAIDRVISDCALEGVRYKMIGHMSKGYRQRVGLAQALLHNPPVLILDEPTSGLDPNQIRDILGLITNLGQEHTVIHSTHILSEVEATSDRVLIINRGKIVAQGTPRELIARGSGPVVFVTVHGVSAESVLHEVGVASFVESAETVTGASGPSGVAGGAVRVAVHGQGGADVAAELFRFAVDKGWVLSELRTETAKLEEVFAHLTKATAPASVQSDTVAQEGVEA
jgi:ABC-2 type transport system ATP-binding protein